MAHPPVDSPAFNPDDFGQVWAIRDRTPGSETEDELIVEELASEAAAHKMLTSLGVVVPHGVFEAVRIA